MTKKKITFAQPVSPFAQPDHYMELRESIRLSALTEAALERRNQPPRPLFSERDIMDGLWTFLIVFTGAMLFLM